MLDQRDIVLELRDAIADIGITVAPARVELLLHGDLDDVHALDLAIETAGRVRNRASLWLRQNGGK